MKTRNLLFALLSLIAFVVGAGVYLLQQEPGDLAYAPPLVICLNHAGPVAAEPAVANATSASNAGQRQNLLRIESEDYAQYVARLRASGCPPTVIGDISCRCEWIFPPPLR